MKSIHPSLTPRKRAGAFSVLELVLVASVLAVLMIVGLAANASFTRKSRDAGCVHNLRTLFQGFQYYINDYGVLPFGAPEPRTDWERNYFDKYETEESALNANYYSGIHARRMSVYIPGGNGNPTGYIAPYLCPADKTPRGNYVSGFLGHSYGFNMTIARENYNRPASWTHPAETFLLADSLRSMLARTVPNNNLDPRHSGNANTLFLDGHVESIAAPFPTWQENRRFWVPDYEN